VIEIDGTSYKIDLPFEDTDYIQGSIRRTGAPYELEMLEAMAAVLDAGDLVLDVGANIGNHTLFLAAVAGARVAAYEPDPRLTDAIERSAEANDFGNLIAVRTVAVSDTPGELTLVDDVDGNLGGQHLVTDETATGRRVPVIRLDDEQQDARVRAMKIDVEGYEINVLEGARELIERDHPDLWVECLDVDHYASISQAITPLGYRFNAVYNPSPTYHFVHDPCPGAESLTDATNRAIERFYTDHALFMKTRESLIEANAKYRAVTQQYADLRDRPAQSAQASDEDVTSNVLAIRQAEDHAATLQADITRLTTELASERRAMESLRRLIDDKDAQLSTLTNKQERYRADFDFLRSHISRTDIALEATENELEEHRDKRAEAEDALESTKRTLAMSTRRLSQLEKRAGALVRARDTQIALAESRAEELRTLGTEERKLRNDLLVSERAQRTLVRARDAQRDRADALQESLTRREDEIHTLSESIDLQKSQETETRSELKRTRSQLGELRRSRTYRAGMAWRDATTWYGFWALVPRLIKIAMERSH
jgi:FkbM family methyltransferase